MSIHKINMFKFQIKIVKVQYSRLTLLISLIKTLEAYKVQTDKQDLILQMITSFHSIKRNLHYLIIINKVNNNFKH
jgi:hypothetical protein